MPEQDEVPPVRKPYLTPELVILDVPKGTEGKGSSPVEVLTSGPS